MKYYKRLVGLVLALMMTTALAVTAYAKEQEGYRRSPQGLR